MADYIGIDLADEYIEISYLDSSMEEPETLSQVKDSEVFLIPYEIVRLKGGRWMIGYEARSNDQPVDFREKDLYKKALLDKKVKLDGEQVSARYVFEIFLQELCSIARIRYAFDKADQIIFTAPKITQQLISLVDTVSVSLPAEQVSLRGHKETFANYALSQQVSVWRNTVFLYEFDGKDLTGYMLTRNETVRPVVAVVKEEIYPKFGLSDKKRKKSLTQLDRDFAGRVSADFEEEKVSSVFLVGEGFEGDWLKESLPVLCDERRVFLGQNLFTKGACLCAKNCSLPDADFVYLGESKTAANLCLDVFSGGRPERLTLLSAGENWYETKGEAEVILDEGKSFTLLLKSPDGLSEKTEEIMLDDLPHRPGRTTRLKIFAEPLSENRFHLIVSDVGFGELFPTSGKTWEYQIKI